MRSSLVCACLVTIAACKGAAKDGVGRASDAGAASVSEAPSVPSAASSAPPVDAAAARPSHPEGLDVILITIDSLRADMPWAGYPRPIAPRLTELEARAVSYTQAYAVSSYTSMSVAGLLGGRLPGEMKRDGYYFGTFPAANAMFPERLQAAGIHTLGAHAHAYFRDISFRQGFDAWEVVPGITFEARSDENVTAPRLEALAEKLLSSPACAPPGRFFAWFHFMDPHLAYKSHDPDVPAWGQTLRDRYDGEVTFTDRSVGKLLDFVASRPWGARTAILVSADHGEGLGEHGQTSHGFELWENLVRVPLLLVIPGAAPRRVEAPRSALDLAPTILDLFGLPPDPALEGKSLVPEIFDPSREPAEDRDVVLDLPATSDSDRRRAIRHGKWKIVAYGEDAAGPVFKLFDLEADPREEHPITRGDDFVAMVQRYRAFEKTVTDVPAYACREGCLNGAYRKRDQDGGAL